MIEGTIKILLVEDNPGDARLIREMLADAPELDFNLELAGCLGDGLKALRALDVHLILLDLELPDSHGVATFLRLHAEAPHLPVIVLTGLDDKTMAVKAVRAGAQDYLVKGQTDRQLLVRSLGYAIERHYGLEALRRQADELASKERQLKTVIDSNADGIVVIDEDGIVRLANPAAEAILDKRSSELQGADFGYPVTSSCAAEIDIVLPNRELRTVEMHVVETEWNGKPAYIAALRDITGHKRMLVELERMRIEQLRIKDQFLSDVSHELRSPLAAIHQFLGILLDGIAGDLSDLQREYLEIVSRNVNQLRKMIDDLLLVARSREGKVTISSLRISLPDIISAITGTFRTPADEKGIVLQMDLAQDLPFCYADPLRVREILTNLLDNALKFTPRGGSIRIGADVFGEDPTYICASVADTGIGISPEDMDRIFGCFCQLDEDEDCSRKGLGLGLYICKELVERQGGRIWAGSEPGQGSTFFFTIPVFSLRRILVPIAKPSLLQEHPITVISVLLIPTNGSPSPDDLEKAMRIARGTVECSIPTDQTVVVSQLSPAKDTGMVFLISCIGIAETESLVRKIEASLAELEGLKYGDIETRVSYDLLDIRSLIDSIPAEHLADRVADKIDDLLSTGTLRGEDYACQKERS
ncbi:MAG: ATP-binding protein [Candidatus Eisenbacteria bacterium]